MLHGTHHTKLQFDFHLSWSVLCAFQVRNPASNLCLDTLQKDEKIEFDMGLYSCQNGASANQVSTPLSTALSLLVLSHTHKHALWNYV